MTRRPREWTRTARCDCGAAVLKVRLGPSQYMDVKHRPQDEVAWSMHCAVCNGAAAVTIGEIKRAA